MSDYLARLSSAALETQAEMRRGNSQQRMRDYAERTMNGGWQELIVDLSTLTTARLFSVQGKQMVAAVIGSTANAVNVYFNNGAISNLLAPGMTYKGPFTQFTLERRGTTVGFLRILVTDDADAVYLESAASKGNSGLQSVNCLLTGGNGQAYATAKYANNPTTLTAAERQLYCIDAATVKFLRAYAFSVGAPNITAGTILLWVYNQSRAVWYASGIEIPLQTGTGRVATGDFEIGVESGLIWAEVYGLTNAAAGGLTFVDLEAS